MEKTLQELADLLQGSIIQGDPSLKLTGVNGLEEAGPTEISFAVPPYLELAGKSRAGAIMIPEEGELKGPQALIRVKNPRAAFAKLLMLFRPPESVESGISQYAFVHPTARIGKNAAILPFAYIAEDAEIGDNAIIYPHVYIGRHAKVGSDCTFYSNVTVRENCIIGDRVILQAGCVIGGAISRAKESIPRSFRQGTSLLAMMSKSAATPVLTEQPLTVRSSARAPRSITLSMSGIMMLSEKTASLWPTSVFQDLSR